MKKKILTKEESGELFINIMKDLMFLGIGILIGILWF